MTTSNTTAMTTEAEPPRFTALKIICERKSKGLPGPSLPDKGRRL